MGKKILTKETPPKYSNEVFQNNITIILSQTDNLKIVNQFINIIELAVYQKKIKNLSFSIIIYEDKDELNDFLASENLSGKIIDTVQPRNE